MIGTTAFNECIRLLQVMWEEAFGTDMFEANTGSIWGFSVGVTIDGQIVGVGLMYGVVISNEDDQAKTATVTGSFLLSLPDHPGVEAEILAGIDGYTAPAKGGWTITVRLAA